MTQVEQLCEEYSRNEMAKLKVLADKIFKKFGGLSQKDYDDFYSIANEYLFKAATTFDSSMDCTFETYLYGILDKKFKSEMTRRNRGKRVREKDIDSFEKPIDAESETTLGDTIVGENGIQIDEGYSDNVAAFMNVLSLREKQFCELIMDGQDSSQIKEIMNLTDKEYSLLLGSLRKFDKASLLKANNTRRIVEKKEIEKHMGKTTQTQEKSKKVQYSIASIIKKINGHTIRFDHPAQRESDQWSLKMKGNLISDIIQGNPIPSIILAEQVMPNGISITWNLDGKQKCTSVYDFVNDGYKISKNIRRNIIQYQSITGLDKDGVPIAEIKEFDIANKKFSQLPSELQERILDYCFEVVLYLNCSDEDIVYHIERYNDGKPMNGSQKGVVRLGSDFAKETKNISNKPFFRDCGDYKASEFRNGTINRIVVETVMATNYLEDWKKSPEDQAEFIREKAIFDDFDALGDTVDRLAEIVNEDICELFNSKDSYIWFTMFEKFKTFGLDDKEFADFLLEFVVDLHEKSVNGNTWDELTNGKGTKDKAVVVGKINHVKYLMCEYFGITVSNVA